MKNLYGGPVMSLSAIVKNLSMEQGNTSRHHYVDNLVRAKNVFKDLLKNTVFLVKYKALKVDKSDNTICMPQDISLLLSINVVDHCGQLVPLGMNPDMNTLQLDKPVHGCSCKKCGGKDTFCEVLDAVQVVNETVELNGYPFNKRTWIQLLPGGVVKRVTEYPYPDLPYPVGHAPTVQILSEEETLCNLDVNENQCIKPTPVNHHKLMTFCGCYILSWQSALCNSFCNTPLSPERNLSDIYPNEVDSKWIRDYYCENNFWPKSDYGYWNWGANAREKVHLKMVRADYAVICYKTNGDNCDGEELLVPEKALDAMQFGITYRQKAWSPMYGVTERRAAKAEYEAAKDEYRRDIYRVSIDTLCDLQTIIPKW